jgi:hypothetical protein
MSGTLQPPRKPKAPSKKAVAEITGGAADQTGDIEGKAEVAATPPGGRPGMPKGNPLAKAASPNPGNAQGGTGGPAPNGPGLPPGQGAQSGAPPAPGGSGGAPAPGLGQSPSGAPGQGPPSGPPSPGAGAGPDPRMLAMFAAAQGGGPGAGGPPPGMPPGGPPPGMPMGAPPPGGPMMGGSPPPGGGAPPGLTGVEAQKLASMGRNGDTLMAHLTPGEIEIPPQLQNPQLLKELSALFHRHGVDIAQFTAGSPQSSTNPQTHVPEYNFLSALLPSLLGIVGGVGGTMLGGPMGGMAGAALGSGAGTAFGGGNAGQIGLSALGAGLGEGVGGGTIGSLWGGGGGDAAAGALGGVGQAAASPGVTAGLADALGPQSLGGASGGGGGMMDQLGNAWNTKAALGAAFGGSMGGALASPTAKAPEANTTAPGFSNHMPAINSAAAGGNYQQQLGNGSAPTTPSFFGYNPQTAAIGGGYNFFPRG